MSNAKNVACVATSVETIQQLHLTRASAVEARRIALQQTTRAVTAAPRIRQELTAKTLKANATQCAGWVVDPDTIADPEQATRYALASLGSRVHALGAEIASWTTSYRPW